MNVLDQQAAGPTYEEICREAYFLWEQDGRPDGRDVDYWLRAELLLRKRQVEAIRKTVWIAPKARATSMKAVSAATAKNGNGLASKRVAKKEPAQAPAKKKARKTS